MKRWSVRFFTFSSTLAVGLAVAWLFLGKETQVIEERYECNLGTPISSLPEGKSEFTPEFQGLANIEQIDPKELKTKLVDVRAYKEYGGDDYRRNEIIAKKGEKWLGLFASSNGLTLHSTKTDVILDHHSIDPENGDWYRFNFAGTIAPVFLLKNSQTLRPGKIPTTFLKRFSSPRGKSNESPAKELRRGFNEKFTMSGTDYVLRVTSGQTLDGTNVNVLVLESGGSTQVVTYNLYHQDSTTLYDSIGELLFVGDLDRDERIDLYISDFGFETGGFGTQLFLSSEAKPGKLVELTASFSTSGC